MITDLKVPRITRQHRRGPGRPRDESVSRAIAEAALELLEEVGYAAITVEGVAARAGVSRTALYRRYRDKADLVTAVIAEVATPVGTLPSLHPREDLVAFLEEFDARFAESCLEVIGGLVGSREHPSPLALHRSRVVAPRMAYARSLLAQAAADGELAVEADLDLALEMLVGTVFARRIAGMPAAPTWATRAVTTIWQGMSTSI